MTSTNLSPKQLNFAQMMTLNVSGFLETNTMRTPNLLKFPIASLQIFGMKENPLFIVFRLLQQQMDTQLIMD